MTSPVRLSEESRERGRDRALDARRRRAEIKRELRAGRLPLADVLAQRQDDPVVARMRVTELVEALPGIGPVRGAQLLEQCGIAPSRRLRGLGQHQVCALTAAVDQRGRRPDA